MKKNELHKLKEASLESNSSLQFTQNINMSPPAVSQFTRSAATSKSKSSTPAKQSGSLKWSTVIPSYTGKTIVKDAEIRWTIKEVMRHFSDRPCLDINSLFKRCFQILLWQ